MAVIILKSMTKSQLNAAVISPGLCNFGSYCSNCRQEKNRQSSSELIASGESSLFSVQLAVVVITVPLQACDGLRSQVNSCSVSLLSTEERHCRLSVAGRVLSPGWWRFHSPVPPAQTSSLPHLGLGNNANHL